MAMTASARKPKGRLAPSPTGNLHLGHAFSFIHAYWQIRKLGGHLILRQEDLDVTRTSPEIVRENREDLMWLGLNWEEERLQSESLQRIMDAARKLRLSGRTYYCACTRGDLRALGAPQAGGEIPYPEICKFKQLTPASSPANSLALRFQVEAIDVSFHDQAQGLFKSNPKKEVGDFPILRKDGSPAYQLAVTVDDYFDGITHVLRGADLLSSTSRQRLLQEALGYPCPTYTHVPLIADAQAVRLAKRHNALSLATLRAAGIKAETIIDWVAAISGLPLMEKRGKGLDSWVHTSQQLQFSDQWKPESPSVMPQIMLPEDTIGYLQELQRTR